MPPQTDGSLLDFEPYLLVNIANEWSGNLLDDEPAIALLRESACVLSLQRSRS